MPDRGKVDSAFFADRIAPHLGADREDVALGPRHGVDFGVLSVGDRAVVAATDPLSVVPELGFERAARFALSFVLADVAVSGIPPSHLAVNFTLPPEMTDAEFATVWETMDAELADLGVSVLTGHTARYEGCAYPWIGGATVLGVGDPDAVVRPDGARPGDRLLVTRGPAVEAASLFANRFPDRLDLPAATVDRLAARLDDLSPVRDALTAAAVGGVTAMHDVTEGGLRGALAEMADAAGVRIEFSPAAVGVDEDVARLADSLGIDPWAATSGGRLVVAVRDALAHRGTPVAVAGEVREGSGVRWDGERVDHPGDDPAWAAWARLAGEE